MKGNAVYKGAYNRCLSMLSGLPDAAELPSENELSHKLGVSRTTVRSVLSSLVEAGIVADGPSHRVLRRAPAETDYFPQVQTESVGTAVERQFMEWILQGDFRPGQSINAAELARRFNTSTTAIREYLTHFQHFGLLERRPNSAWVFKGVTPDFAEDIYEIREMFELRSAHRFAELPPEAQGWKDLATIEQEHHRLMASGDVSYADFSRLDERFHRLILDTSHNRFILDFYGVLSMIFHYHYQWNKADEAARNKVAMQEHLAYIAALNSRDVQAIDAKCRAHLRTARATLMRSIDQGPFRA